MTPPSISVVTPVHNGAGYLNRCLDAIAASEAKPFEVIVVDDASTDGSAALVKARGDAALICLDVNKGAGAARNAGVAKARGEIIVFVDADVCVHPDALGKIAGRLSADPGLSAVMGAYDDAPAADSMASRFRNLLHAHTHQIGRREARTFWTGLGGVRRAACLEVGGLPVVDTLEDVAFGQRLIGAGHRIALDPDIKGAHLKRWTLSSMIRTDLFGRGVPWIRMTLSGMSLGDDLNTRLTQKISVATALILSLLFGLIVLQGGFQNGDRALGPPIALLLAACLACWPDADAERPRLRAVLLFATAGSGGVAALWMVAGPAHGLAFGAGALAAATATARAGPAPRQSPLFSLATIIAVSAAAAALPLTIATAAFAAIMAIYIALNFSFFRFVKRTAGLADAIAAAPLLIIYHLVCGLSVVVGATLHFTSGRKAFTDLEPVKTE